MGYCVGCLLDDLIGANGGEMWEGEFAQVTEFDGLGATCICCGEFAGLIGRPVGGVPVGGRPVGGVLVGDVLVGGGLVGGGPVGGGGEYIGGSGDPPDGAETGFESIVDPGRNMFAVEG